jgi:hypothetical protein
MNNGQSKAVLLVNQVTFQSFYARNSHKKLWNMLSSHRGKDIHTASTTDTLLNLANALDDHTQAAMHLYSQIPAKIILNLTLGKYYNTLPIERVIP